MPGKWDTGTKHLLGENPEHFIKWLLPKATFKWKAKHKTPNLDARQIEADNLYEVWIRNKRYLVHIEFQSKYDRNMAKRMWEYNMLATFSYQLPTYSFVIYLKKCTATKPYYSEEFPTKGEVHHFRFSVIELWKISPEEIKQTGLVGLFPLMVLAKGGKHPEVVEDIITSLEAVGGKSNRELLSLTYVLASLVFDNEADKIWLKRRFNMLRDVLRDTWAYQEIMQEGRQEERQQRLDDQRQTLMAVVQTKFPKIVPFVNQQANIVDDPELLQSVILKVVTAKTEEQALQVLRSLKQSQKQK